MVLSNAGSVMASEQPSLLESMGIHQTDRGTRLCLSAQCLVTVSDQGSIPVTLELDSPSITVDSCCFGLWASSGAPKAGAASSATLMKHDERNDGSSGLLDKKQCCSSFTGSIAGVSERCGWLELQLIGSSHSLRLSIRIPVLTS